MEDEIDLRDIDPDLYKKIEGIINKLQEKGFKILTSTSCFYINKKGENKPGDSFICYNFREVEVYLKGHASGEYDESKKHERKE